MQRWGYLIIPAIIVVGLVVVAGRFRDTTSDPAKDPNGGKTDVKKPNGGNTDGTKGAEPTTLEERIKLLIAQLGADAVEDREQAEQQLLAIGMKALPYLQEATRSPIPEISARAKALVKKLLAQKSIPDKSLSVALPINSILFVETLDANRLKERWKKTPVSRAWALAQAQTWWKKYQDDEYDEDDKRSIEQLNEIVAAVKKRTAAIMGPPTVVDEKELHPPFVFVAEADDTPHGLLSSLARRYFTHIGDPPDARRDHPPFVIEEHTTTQSVFQDALGFYSLTPVAMMSLLNGLLSPPKESLADVVTKARAMIPDADVVVHASRNGLEKLVDAGHELEEDLVTTFDIIGLTPGSTIDGAVKLVPVGFQERYVVNFTGKSGLVTTLAKLPVAATPPGAAAKAIDAVPAHVAIWMSLRGNMAAGVEGMAESLRKLDNLMTLPKPMPKPTPGQDPKTLKPLPPPTDPARRIRWDALYLPRVERLEKLTGLKLEDLIRNIVGPVEIGLFNKVVGDEEPDDIPLGLVVSVVLRDPAKFQTALDSALKARFTFLLKEARDGGNFYYSKQDLLKPGVWLKGKHLVFATEEKILGLCIKALGGQLRFMDRGDVKKAVADNVFSKESRLTVFADGGQALEMPYKLGETQFNWDDENPWPKFSLIRGFFSRMTVEVTPGAKANEFEINASTPLTVLGVIEAFRRPLNEAGYP